MAKRKGKETPEDSIENDGALTPDDKDESGFSDEIIFIEDTKRKWVAREKPDKDGLTVKHHLLIFHITIKASWYPDDLYPTIWDKCVQYHQERDLAGIDVTVKSFYKSYSSVEYSDLKVPKIERKRKKKIRKLSIEIKKPKYKIIKKKYIELDLIDSVFPFILKWYPTAIFFVQTLNNDPYRLNEEHFYWIYRRVKEVSTEKIKLKHFFENNCPHLNFNAFKSQDYRQSGNKIPSDIKTYIKPYLRMHYPEILDKEKRNRKEKQEYFRKKVIQLYWDVKKEYPQKIKLFMKKYFPHLIADSTKANNC